MAKGNKEAKVKFLAETGDFRKEVTQATSKMTELRSELRLNEEQMKTSGETADLLADRQKLLEEQLEQARLKTQNLAAQMESCTASYGENSVEAQKLTTQINNAKIAEEKIKQEIAAVSTKLSEQATESTDTRNALELLEDEIAGQESALASLKSECAAMTIAYGENSDEARTAGLQIEELSEKLKENKKKLADAKDAANEYDAGLKDTSENANKTKTALESLENAISEQESAMSDLKNEYAEAVLTYGQNSKEANSLAKEIRSLGSELNDNKTKMNNAQSAADKLEEATQDAGDAAEEANDGFTIWKGTLADLASNAIQGAWSGITGLASSFWNLGDETRELRTNMNKVETAFESAGLTADDASETYENFYGILADEGQATEAVGHLAKLAQSQEDLSEWTDICTGIYATFGDSLPIEGLTEAANETIKTGAVTGSLADALNWSTMSSEEWQTAFEGHPKALKKFQSALKKGMTTEEAFNEALTKCTTESEREQVIRQALTGLYGEAAAAYAETSGSIIEANKAQANYNSALSGLGEIIEPIKTSFTNGMASMLEAVTELISGMDTEAIQAGIQTAFDYINNTVFPAIKTGIQWFIDNKDLVVAGITAIVAGIAAFKIVSLVQTAVGIFKSFKAAQQGVTIAQQALNLVMKANPIGLIISLIVALVAGFIYLWNNCEGFREFWIGLWDNIKEYAGIAIDWLVGFFTETIPAAWDSFKEYASTLWNELWTSITTIASDIWTSVTTFFTNIGTDVSTAISTMWTDVTTWFSSLWTSLTETVTGIWTDVTTKFGEVKTGVVETVSGLWTDVTAKFTELWTSLTGTVTSIWTDITTKFEEVKTSVVDTVEGLWDDVTGKFDDLWSTLTDTVSNIWSDVTTKFSEIKSSVFDTVGGIFDDVSGAFSDVWSNATEMWNNIKSAIEDPINNAKETISGVVENIKDALDFEWNIPKPSIPHFTVSGGKAPWGFLGEGSLPKVSVDWYAKGAILEAPTLFGVGKNGNLMGGGEAGAEAVAPIDVLLGYVREAVSDVMGALTFTFEGSSSMDRLETYLNSSNNDMGRLIDAIEDLASRAINIDIDSMRVATATAGASDNVSGNRLNLKTRGLAL